MKKVLTLLLIVAFALGLSAQNCDIYIPFKEGATQTYASYNAKGKKEGEHKQTLISKSEVPGATVFVVRQEYNDGKEGVKTKDFTYRCEGDKFVFDMNSFVDDKQMESFAGANVKVSFESIDIPNGVSPGMTLPDGSVTIGVDSSSPVNLGLKILITDRKVEGKESITTPAGTFDCIKISQTVTTNMAFIKVSVFTVEWMAKNVGSVKSETYSKNNKLMSYTQLIDYKN